VTDAECAYAAGLFDGEGTVWVGLAKLQVVWTNTNLTLLRWIQERWGGAIYKQTPHGLANTAHPVYQLRQNSLAEQAAVLRDMEPFLVQKGALARNALAFADLKKRWGGSPPAGELVRLAKQHKLLRGIAPPEFIAEVEQWEQLDAFAPSKADKP
jgi:hypothetical protein